MDQHTIIGMQMGIFGMLVEHSGSISTEEAGKKTEAIVESFLRQAETLGESIPSE